MHLTEMDSLTSGEPNQMNQAAKPLHTHTHTHTHTTARPQRTDISMGRRRGLDSRDSIRPLAQLPVTEQNRGGWKMQEDFENIKNKESNGSKNTTEENSLKSGFTAVEESSDQPVEREGRLLLEWWMWMHREPRYLEEPHPLKVQSHITQTQG